MLELIPWRGVLAEHIDNPAALGSLGEIEISPFRHKCALTVAEIDLVALRSNFRALRAVASHGELMVVVKADAYGHGAVAVARTLIDEGCRHFGVATLDEARELGLEELFVSALAGRALVRLVLKDDRIVGEERLLTELNARIRGVSEGPDGALYVLTDGNEGKILRLVPKK